MTRRYQQRAAVLSQGQAEAIEHAMLGGGNGVSSERGGVSSERGGASSTAEPIRQAG